MACKKYYFDQDYYHVDFYEEEVTELQEEKAAAASSSHTESVVELGHLNAMMDHNYNREDKDGTHGESCEPAQEGQDPVFKKPSIYFRKQYKFTPEQIIELDRVFKETQYPDAVKRYVCGLTAILSSGVLGSVPGLSVFLTVSKRLNLKSQTSSVPLSY